MEQLTEETPIEVPDSPPLPSLAIHLGRTKTTTGEDDEVVYLTGRPVEALNAGLTAARIDMGSVFRGIGRWGTVSRRALDPQSIDTILKHRAGMAGLDPGEFSAHGLRSGYLTEAADRGIPLPEAMDTVAPSISATGVQLLQQRDEAKRACGPIVVGSAITVRIAKARSIQVLLFRNL
ncbi:integrase (fragment) (plasmid) [Agrobacterium pusense]|uniref:Integrase n=1 Tax=Agrobacterium pusense TaxID=648995 RepID=U4Q383_9HYPH